MDRRLAETTPVVGHQIDDEVIRHILDKLDKLQSKDPFDRANERFPYRRRGVEVEIEHIGGTHAKLRVWSRNISAGGISLVHGSFIHPGSRCTITLARRDEEPQQVSGVVRWCRLLSGIIHEVGVQFEAELDMELFVNVALLREQAVAEVGKRRLEPSRADLIKAADALMLEIDHLIEPPNLNRAKELCRRMQQIATQLDFDDLRSVSKLAWDSLQHSGSVARSEPLLRKVQSLSRQLTTLRDVA